MLSARKTWTTFGSSLFDGSPGKRLTNFKAERISDFRWSVDGSKVGFIRGHTDSDVVLLQESKP